MRVVGPTAFRCPSGPLPVGHGSSAQSHAAARLPGGASPSSGQPRHRRPATSSGRSALAAMPAGTSSSRKASAASESDVVLDSLLASGSSATVRLLAGGTTCVAVEVEAARPPQTMPQGPQQPVTQTQVGDRLASASRKRRCTSGSAGVSSAAVASTSEARPGSPSCSKAAPLRMRALEALPLITSVASAQCTASVNSPSLRRTAAKFCVTAKRKSSNARGVRSNSLRANRRKSPPGAPTQMAWSDPRSFRKYSSNTVKALITTPKKFRLSYRTISPTFNTVGWCTALKASSQRSRASMYRAAAVAKSPTE
mmetsp:Transcript_141631/g.394851  ORF Transcript_141631/g.394851 Transcript_141631/m.394851 type:complete len:311 (+) Transcript_141631:263-1195(+)